MLSTLNGKAAQGLVESYTFPPAGKADAGVIWIAGDAGDVLRRCEVHGAQEKMLWYALGLNGAQARRLAVATSDVLRGHAPEGPLEQACGHMLAVGTPISAYPSVMIAEGEATAPTPLSLLDHLLASLALGVFSLDNEPGNASNKGEYVVGNIILSNVVVALVSAALGECAEFRTCLATPGRRGAHLAKLLHEIRVHAHEPSFSPEIAAKNIGVHVRYLHAILEGTGKTFGDWVRDRRLDRTYMELATGASAAKNIATIAYQAGFESQSSFNHAFKKRFSRNPTSVRKAFLKSVSAEQRHSEAVKRTMK